MVIFCLIANVKGQNSGRGGSFYSSSSVAKALSSNHQVYFFLVGDFKSEAVKNILGDNYIHLNTNSFLKSLISLLKFSVYLFKFKPSVVQLFSTKLKLFGELSNILVKSKIIFTKCGGKSPNLKDSFYSNVTTFSKENYEYFLKFKNETDSIKRLAYIPQRILPFPQNEILIDEIKRSINYQKDDFIILRIGRINKYYETGVIQTLEFYKRKKQHQINTKLILIGYKSDLDIPSEFIDSGVFILDDDKFTNNPKAAISIANIKIANGRSAMECCHVGGELLVPSKKHGLIQFNKSTLSDLIFYNFSERTVLSENYTYNTQLNSQKFTKHEFDKLFNIHLAAEKYISFFRSAFLDRPKLKRFLGSIYNFYFVFIKKQP